MKTKLLLALVLSAGLAAPAAAQTFFVVQDTKTKKCTVVREKPTVETTVVVNEDGVTYTTEEEAMAATKKIKVCTVE